MNKHFKVLCAVMMLIMLLFTFGACTNKNQDKLGKAEALLSEASYLFETIADDCSYAEKYGDYESMQEELGITQLRCEEMHKKIEEAMLFGYKD